MAGNLEGACDRMVEQHLAGRGIRDPRLLAAMRQVPRELFVPENLRAFAYDDRPLPILEGQTISQPYIVAWMIEAATIDPSSKVLEVGAGSGYAAAVLGQVAGKVFAVERHLSLAEQAAGRLVHLGLANVVVITGDGSGGLPAEAPFDAILVAARGAEVPEALKRQLAVGGRLVMPVGSEATQSLCRVTRTGEESWVSEDLGPVRFVPLIGAHGLPEHGTGTAGNHRSSSKQSPG